MMRHAAKKREQERRARARLRVLHHFEQVTRNVSQTCRFWGISRTLFYRWRDRYRQDGLGGLHDGPRGPRHHPFTTPPHIVALILEIRREREYGPLRIRFFLERYHQVYVSAPTIHRILKRHRVPRVSLNREIDTQPSLKITFSAPSTGKSFSYPAAGAFIQDYSNGGVVGSPAIATVTGVLNGTGSTAPNAGKLVFNAVVVATTPEGIPVVDFTSEISTSGHFNDDLAAARCAALSGP
jgi:transposase-like protein